MKLLVLGGTAFLGRAIARYAVRAGHDVTCLARGSAPVPAGVGLVVGDRDRDDAFEELGGETWDAVIDVTRQPGQARRAVRTLAARHRVFVSSGNVYRRFDQPGQSEDAPTLEPLAEDVMADMTDYGAAKVACENAIREGSSSHTIVRSGLIGGEGDWSGRSGYYPWRFAHPTGPEVLVPPDLTFPTALIDVEDLAAWIIHCAVERVHGTFNATGPTTDLGSVLTLARSVAASGAVARPVPADVLQAAGVSAWMGTPSLPLWIDDESWRYFATLDTTAARAQGLRTRPLDETLRAALTFEERRAMPRQTGLTDDEERHLRDLLG